jgi:hypothetical protein
MSKVSVTSLKEKEGEKIQYLAGSLKLGVIKK